MNDFSAGGLDLLDAPHDDVLDALGADTTPQGRALLSAWRAARRAAADPGRSWQVALMIEMLRRGHTVAARQLRSRRPAEWLPQWAAGPPVNPGLQHIHRLGNQIAATTVAAIDGRHVALCFDQDGVVHTIDLLDGSTRTRQMSQGRLDFYPDATFGILGGRQIVAAVTEEQALVWDVSTGELLTATDPDDIPRRAGTLASIEFGQVAGAEVVFVGASEGYLLLWSIPDGERVAKFNDGHSCHVSNVTISPQGPPVAVSGSGGEAPSVCFWDLAARQQIGQPRPTRNISRSGWTRLAGRQHAVTVDETGLLQLWLPQRQEPVASYPTGVISTGGLACTAVDERPIVILASGGRIRCVDLLTGQLVGDTMSDFTQRTTEVAVTPPNVLARSIVAVQGFSTEGRVNILDLTVASTGVAFSGERDTSDNSTARTYLDADLVTVAGRQVIAAIGSDAKVWLHDVNDGTQVGPSLAGFGPERDYGIRLRCLTSNNRPVGISATPGPFTAFHLDDGSRLPLDDHGLNLAALADLACGSVGQAEIVVLGGHGGTMLTWDLQTMRLLGHRRGTTPDAVCALALTELAGRPVVLSAGREGLLHRWEADLTAYGDPIAVHGGRICALDTVDIDGRPTAVTVGDDGLTSSWDLQTGERLGPALLHASPVRAVLATTFAGVPAAITAGDDRILRIRDLLDGKLLETVTTPRPIKRIFTTAGDNLVLLDGQGLIRLDRQP
jgi:WD40 repeat protein